MFKFYRNWQDRRRARKAAKEAAQLEVKQHMAKLKAKYQAKIAALHPPVVSDTVAPND